MRLRPRLLAPALASTLAGSAASFALAQPDLPPPPPPPIGQSGDETPAPAQSAPTPSAPPGATPSGTGPPGAASRRATAAPSRPARRGAHVSVGPVEPSRPVAITVDPLPMALGRLSGNVELLVQPHHSLVLSPNALVAQVGRGGAGGLVAEGFGFATVGSAGVGIELGYHYWFDAQRTMRGPFVGPSLLLGSTAQASVGDPSHAQPYWGAAFDGGLAKVFDGGPTIAAGAGVGVLRMADATAVFPRILLQAGWSL